MSQHSKIDPRVSSRWANSRFLQHRALHIQRMMTTTNLPVRNGYHAKLWTTDKNSQSKSKITTRICPPRWWQWAVWLMAYHWYCLLIDSSSVFLVFLYAISMINWLQLEHSSGVVLYTGEVVLALARMFLCLLANAT